MYVHPLRSPQHNDEDMEFLSSFNSLHEDLYTEILIRLDAKSLARFKLVSKDWYLFLSNDYFTRHYSESRPSITGFFYETSTQYKEKLRYVSIDTKEDFVIDPPSCLGFLDGPARLVNSCNGLLHWVSSWDQQFISNPLTNKSVALPWPIPRHQFFACGIAFDPLVSDHFVVVVLLLQSRINLKSRIFSSETMEWGEMKEIVVIPHRPKPKCCKRGVFLNGFLHWEMTDNAILVYDVKGQSGWMMKSPMNDELVEKLGFSEPGCLGGFGGKLHYCRVIGTLLCVWVATQYSSSNSTIWVEQHSVNLYNVMCENSSIIPHGSQALAFLCHGEEILLCVKGKIIGYRFDDNAVREVCKVQRSDGSHVEPSMFFPFVHTLALFNLPLR
ncbi:hypothetical protein L1049_015981 [Liquidambar formosana]|uniref:F-box domain-containing protein n=1 Tax=Liquidambar formosana TaxID=63359 RepID=A0AAP0X6Y1_LIQFO